MVPKGLLNFMTPDYAVGGLYETRRDQKAKKNASSCKLPGSNGPTPFMGFPKRKGNVKGPNLEIG